MDRLLLSGPGLNPSPHSNPHPNLDPDPSQDWMWGPRWKGRPPGVSAVFTSFGGGALTGVDFGPSAAHLAYSWAPRVGPWERRACQAC